MLRTALIAIALVVLPAARPASAPAEDGLRMTVARLQYDGGGDWYANPSSLPNLLEAIATRTSLHVERTEARVKPVVSSLGRKLSFKQTAQGTMVIGGGSQGRLASDRQ